jgi:predicted nucleic acid-binding protein
VNVDHLVHVVLDANVYIDAVCAATQPDGFPPRMDLLPALPPRRKEPTLHVLGEIYHGARRGIGPVLHVSDHILAMVENRLLNLKWDVDAVETYVDALVDLAELSGGGYYEDVPRTQHDSADHEDNLILDLAVAVSATLVISNDSDLLLLSRRTGWKGRPIISPLEFAQRADLAARRQQRERD